MTYVLFAHNEVNEIRYLKWWNLNVCSGMIYASMFRHGMSREADSIG